MFGCVSMCCLRCVVGCVSVGVDALAVVCGGDVFQKKTKSVIPKKYFARKCVSITVFISFKKLDPASNYDFYGCNSFEKTIKSPPRISSIISAQMVRVPVAQSFTKM